MDYIQKMLTDFAWKLDEYYSGNEHPEHIEKLVQDFLTEYNPYDQPERLSPEDCDHSGINIMIDLCSKTQRCKKCNSIFTVCDSLNSMET